MVKKDKKAEKVRFEWPFGPRNYLFFGLGIVMIVVGYITLASGSITLAPILLVLGYCVLIPLSIIISGKSKTAPVEEVKTEG
jgi:uncharacterized membrane protein HdeD (DUF308 family)